MRNEDLTQQEVELLNEYARQGPDELTWARKELAARRAYIGADARRDAAMSPADWLSANYRFRQMEKRAERLNAKDPEPATLDASDADETIQQIVEQMGVDRPTASRWYQDFRQQTASGLKIDIAEFINTVFRAEKKGVRL